MRRAQWFALAVVGAVALVWIFAGRLPSLSGSDLPAPASDRAAALALVDSLRRDEGRGVNPECRTRIVGPSDTSGRGPVIVLLHGFTNCPKQFDRLAASFAARGFAVVVPLLPRHGRADRMSLELGRLNAEEFVRAGNRAVDVARGLGEPVVVVGLSSSGVLAGWLAQHRDDVHAAVLLAPSLAPRRMPEGVARRMTRALLALPNFYVWWDSKAREKVPGPTQTYPRFASRGLAEIYRLGFILLADAARERPRAKRIVLVTTEDDRAVSNEIARELVRRWRTRGAEVETFEFPESLDVRHDMIDPDQPYQRTAVTYPVIERMVVSAAGGD